MPSVGLGCQVAASTVGKILHQARRRPGTAPGGNDLEAGPDPQAQALLACDVVTVDAAFLKRVYVLFFLEIGTAGSTSGDFPRTGGGSPSSRRSNARAPLTPRAVDSEDVAIFVELGWRSHT